MWDRSFQTLFDHLTSVSQPDTWVMKPQGKKKKLPSSGLWHLNRRMTLFGETLVSKSNCKSRGTKIGFVTETYLPPIPSRSWDPAENYIQPWANFYPFTCIWKLSSLSLMMAFCFLEILISLSQHKNFRTPALEKWVFLNCKSKSWSVGVKMIKTPTEYLTRPFVCNKPQS